MASKDYKHSSWNVMKHLENSAIVAMSISAPEKPFLANLVLENELWMGIQFSEIYFGLEL